MRFSKQIRSLDRRFFALRKHSRLLNRLYNHISKINIDHSLHHKVTRERIKQDAQKALHQYLAPTKHPQTTSHIPKIIWLYWNAGFTHTPEVVTKAIESWQRMNPDYEIKLLCDDNLTEILGFDLNKIFQLASVRCLLPTKADFLRLHLLSRFGGVWVDATTFCLQPLHTWLPQALTPCGLFTFKQKNNPTRPIEAWFIAAPQGSQILNDIMTNFINYIMYPRRISLFVSGKLRLLDSIMTQEERERPLEPDFNKKAEPLGFMPYFSIGYFFYRALKTHLSAQQLSLFLREDGGKAMTNAYALTKDDESALHNAVISKQTYLSSYTRSQLYQQRLQFLSKQLQAYTSSSTPL